MSGPPEQDDQLLDLEGAYPEVEALIRETYPVVPPHEWMILETGWFAKNDPPFRFTEETKHLALPRRHRTANPTTATPTVRRTPCRKP